MFAIKNNNTEEKNANLNNFEYRHLFLYKQNIVRIKIQIGLIKEKYLIFCEKKLYK